MKNYTVEIIESSKELSLKEKILAKDSMRPLSIDELSKENKDFAIDYAFYVLLKIHNEMSENKDYEKLVIFDKSGYSYSTGSKSFLESFLNIIEEIQGNDIDEFMLGVRRTQSKNYKGKEFLSCVIV